MDGDDPRMLDPAAVVGAMPFAARAGVRIDTVTPEAVTGRMPWAADRCTAGGTLHGGALMTLADTLGAVCAFVNLPAGATTSTLESKTNFFRPVRDGEVGAVARPLHVGRSTIVVQTDIRDAAGRRVAQVTQTQAVRG
jgi:1,4-dihydroxy-2-naphthoyl-CoA hydrolase